MVSEHGTAFTWAATTVRLLDPDWSPVGNLSERDIMKTTIAARPVGIEEASSDSTAGASRRSFLAAMAATASTAASATVFARDYGPNAPPVRYPEPDVVVIDDRFKKYKLGNSPIQRVYHSQEMLWAEGPAWNGVGKYLVWSDIPNNVQLRWLLEDGHVSKFRQPSNNSNGNTFAYQGRQISCEHLTRRVVRYEPSGKVTVLAEKARGSALREPPRNAAR